MRLQDNNQQIQIHVADDAGQTLTCPSAEFAGFEPTYQPLTDNQVRVWTLTLGYVSDNGNQRGDGFYTPERLAEYCGKVAIYQAAYAAAHPPEPELPAIYADITLAGAQTATGFFCLDNSGTNAQTVTACLRATAATSDGTNILPIGTAENPVIWNIILREARTINHDVITEGASDPVYTILPASFVGGVCQFEWRVHGNKAAMCYVRERDFGRVTWPDGTVYQVKLIAPVQLVIYEM